MPNSKVDCLFWKGKQVFLTGHTGFKGGWLSIWLGSMGAHVTGFALDPNTTPSLFNIVKVEQHIDSSVIGNIEDQDLLTRAMQRSCAEIVIHMAAQPLVRHSYANPVETYKTNVLGTAHVLEAVRRMDCVKAVVIVTTDKCYENTGSGEKFREGHPLGGYDPYSSSKACAELVTAAFRHSYFTTTNKRSASIASARAGNVIGGGDWSDDRLIPDALRAFEQGLPLGIRNPNSVRPWQHVLEPLSGYLLLAQALYREGHTFAEAWNFGPKDSDARSVQVVVDLLTRAWEGSASWQRLEDYDHSSYEAGLLKLDISKANTLLNWHPKWSLETAVSKVIEWHKALSRNEDMLQISLNHIRQHQDN